VRHAGNDVSPDTNPNRYTLFNQRARKEDRTVSLGEHLKLGRVVCREMALLTEVALEDAGIRSKVVKGDVRDGKGWSSGHAWNEVLVDGTWYVVDTTSPQLNWTKHNDRVSRGTPNGWLWTESISELWVVNRTAVSGRLQK
jgi:transglutaminase-like putative cysteine protease